MAEHLTYTQRMNRLARLERLALRLDSRFRLPILGIRFGWDSVIGLLPVIGDLAATLPSVFIIYEGVNMGVRRRVLARMSINTAVDLFVGGVPIVGDIFDVQFKSHQRNVALLRRDVMRGDLGLRRQ